MPGREQAMKEPKEQASGMKPVRMPTGIPGFDGMVQGGLERGSINVLAGEAGTGKSIMSLQFLYNGVTKYNETSLYITFEEKKKPIMEHMKQFGWEIADLERKKRFFVFEYTPQEVERFIKDGGTIEKVIRDNGVDRLVFDSITSFAVLHETEQKRREAIVKLMDLLKRWGCTTILPSEAAMLDSSGSGEVRAKFGIEYLADSLFSIYSVRKGDIREMALEVIKMRGTAHSKKLAPLKITNEGAVLYPDQPFFSR